MYRSGKVCFYVSIYYLIAACDLLHMIEADAGTIFCGADLVKWMVQNIDGVENEKDAETLGQLLLDKGALFHTEGSKYVSQHFTYRSKLY